MEVDLTITSLWIWIILGKYIGNFYSDNAKTRKALRECRPPPSMLTVRLVSISSNFRITPKIESPVVCAIPDIPSKFQKDPSVTFWIILPTQRQTNKQTKSGKNITSLAEVMIWSQWHMLTGSNDMIDSKYKPNCLYIVPVKMPLEHHQ